MPDTNTIRLLTDDNTTKLVSVLGPILSGGFAGAVFSFLTNCYIARKKRLLLHEKLSIEQPRVHLNVLTVRVKNGYVLPLTHCWAYIKVEYDKQDIVLRSDPAKAIITPTDPFELLEDRLCWSLFDNPPSVPIYADESQSLQVLDFDPDKKCIGVFSEKRDKPYRVFLRGDKEYRGYFKIVSRETVAKKVNFRLDLRDAKFPEGLITG
jgi:hypothetical protein